MGMNIRATMADDLQPMRTGARVWAVLAMAALLSACAAAAPKPAMVPLGQTGDFGYTERDLGADRIEVTYTGDNIRISSSQGREDSRVAAERDKVHDLALWRAAQIADQRGMAAIKIENETRDTDVQVTQQYVQRLTPFGYRPYPYWGYPGYWHRPSWFYDEDYYYQPVRRAYAQTTATLTVRLLKQHDPADKTQLSVKETLARLQAARSGAAY